MLLVVNFKNGKADGLATGWYENGQKSFEANYKNGKEDGLRTGWYKNGQKWLEENYKNGELVETICDGDC
jgi:antitoxin component YwqK of YwqJK toxin-antitoxin module